MLSYYTLLKIDPLAGPEDIEISYRNFLDGIHRYGPGIEFGESELAERFPEIAQGYTVLRDPQKRKVYDEMLFSPIIKKTETIPIDLETTKVPLITRLSNYLLALVFLVTLLYALSRFFAL